MNELTTIYPEQLWIELSSKERDKAWQKTQIQPYSNAASRWNAYLNWLCLNSFVTWLKEDDELAETIDIWPQEEDLASFWDLVNGTKLTVGETKLVLIPSDKSYLPEFRIPQEWVDIPNWVADYYLAVQLNLDEGWLRVWGYATHDRIWKEGKFDRLDRTYCLDREDLIEDINVMWVARELFTAKTLAVKPLPNLSSSQTEKLLKTLSKQTAYSPRLDLAFEEWASLIANNESRQKLYQLRSKLNQQIEDETSQPKANDLRLWLQNIFEASWQSIDTLLTTQPQKLAVNFRSDSTLKAVRVKGAKVIDLGMEIKGITVILLVGFTLEIDDKVSIRVQLHPASNETYLPQNIKLSLLSQSGVMLQEVESRSYDNYIQLKRFKSPARKGFSIQVTLGNAIVKEDFVLSGASVI